MDPHPIRVVEATEEDRGRLAHLLGGYLRERAEALGRDDPPAAYRYLDAYWSDPGRHSFLIRAGDQIMGLALVRGPASTGAAVTELAEFYVAPPHRRRGVGQQAALGLLRAFPGPWELEVHRGSTAAQGFWRSVLTRACGSPPEPVAIEAADGPRWRYRFTVEPPAES